MQLRLVYEVEIAGRNSAACRRAQSRASATGYYPVSVKSCGTKAVTIST